MANRIGDLALLELVERFGSGTEVLGQPIVIHCSEYTWIIHLRPDLIEFRAGETALQLDRHAECLEHVPLRWPQLAPWPIRLPLLGPDRGDHDRSAGGEPIEQAHG